jgi:hypothetical protein
VKLCVEKGLYFGPTIGFSTMTVLPHSTDLVPNDSWLFSEMKSDLKGRIFQDSEDIQNNVTTAL